MKIEIEDSEQNKLNIANFNFVDITKYYNQEKDIVEETLANIININILI